MDDKTKNDQQESNEDKDELELFTRNTSKKRRQKIKGYTFSNQNKDDTSQQADFDEEIYLINKDFKKKKAMMKIMILLLVMRMIIISMILQTLILKMRIIDILKKLTTKMNRMELQSTTNNINQL